STSSSKKITSTSSTKKASTSSAKPTSSSKKSSTMITMSSMIQHGATTKTIVTTSSIPALVSGSSYKASSSVKSSSSKAAASSSAKASSSSCATVAAPASTQTGIVSGCTKWYTAKSGDYCYVIAAANGISTDTFMSWNPAVNAPSCNNIQVGYAYCVATCSSGSSSSSALTAAGSSVAATSPAASTATIATQTSASGSSSSSTSVASTAYRMYTGNGTVAAGWPAQSQWMDFDDMFTANIPIMQQSCANNGWGANNSPTEIADIKAAITKVSAASGVDPRFILAIVMQESNGCVRVVTTSWSVANPGLMQDHAGSGTCNSGGVIQDPCPASEIEQMIVDGTEGTASGDGLVQCLKETDVTDVSMYYRAARIYNGGLGGYHADDLGTGCCTLCYASDVANRLTGWSSGLSGCTL
ncbi:carbohydrate-binding module family 50 protein, partial [Aureobasidium melanogenum]